MEKGVTGVYTLTCLPSGRRYVGASEDVRERFYRHRYRLRHGKHYITAMQADWDEYGEASFKFTLILTCDAAGLGDAEQAALNEAHAAGLCYNPSTAAVAARGYQLTPDQRENLRTALTGHTTSEETRRKIGEANRAKWAERGITPEVREQMAAMGRKGKGRPKPEEHRRKIGEAQKGRQFSAETRSKMSAAKKGRKLTDEQRKAIGDGQRGHPCYTAKLTEDKVREIKRRLAAAAGKRGIGSALAAEFGISPAVISAIKNGHIWQGVA